MGRSASGVASRVALVGYAAAVTLAVLAGVVGAPRRAGATVVDAPLLAARAAALAHVAAAVLARVAGRAIWRAAASPPVIESPAPSPLEAFAASCAAATLGAVLAFALVACHGVSALDAAEETAHLAALLASLVLVPGAATYGVGVVKSPPVPNPDADADADPPWRRVLFRGGGGVGGDVAAAKSSRRAAPADRVGSHPLDPLWFGGAWGAVSGAWLGAIPTPLDWDRPWQRWPVAPVVCASIGFVAATWAAVFFSLAAATNPRRLSDGGDEANGARGSKAGERGEGPEAKMWSASRGDARMRRGTTRGG